MYYFELWFIFIFFMQSLISWTQWRRRVGTPEMRYDGLKLNSEKEICEFGNVVLNTKYQQTLCVDWSYPVCTLSVPCVYTVCTLCLHWSYPVSTLIIPCVYTDRTLCVHSSYPVYTLIVPCVYTDRTLCPHWISHWTSVQSIGVTDYR